MARPRLSERFLLVARVVRRLREEAGLTQVEVARRGGLHPSRISRHEGGHCGLTSHETCVRYARGLGVAVDVLLDAIRAGEAEPVLGPLVVPRPDADPITAVAEAVRQLGEIEHILTARAHASARLEVARHCACARASLREALASLADPPPGGEQRPPRSSRPPG